MRRMRGIVAAGMFLVVGLGGVGAGAAEDGNAKLWRVVTDCYDAKWQGLEDGISDAGTLARAIALSCATEFRRYMVATGQYPVSDDGLAEGNALIRVLALRNQAKRGDESAH